jgi:hypothetical protein
MGWHFEVEENISFNVFAIAERGKTKLLFLANTILENMSETMHQYALEDQL